MSKRETKILSLLLVVVLSWNLLPMSAIASNRTSPVIYDTSSGGAEPQPEATVVSEVTSLRDETVKHFRMSDGSYRAVQYGFAVHYQDGNEWIDYDNTLTYDSANEAYITRNGAELRAFSADASTGRLLTAADGEYSVSLGLAQDPPSLEDGQLSAGAEAAQPDAEYDIEVTSATMGLYSLDSAGDTADAAEESDTSRLSYRDVIPGADIEYMLVGGNVKENIVLKEQPESGVFSFTMSLTGLTPQAQPDGSIIFVNEDDEEIFCIPAPFMYDDAGEISYDVEYSVAPTDDGYSFTITADHDWLADESRQYPVVIDPTLEKVATTKSSDVMTTVMLRSGSPYDPGNTSIMYWGYDSSTYAQHEVGLARVHQLPEIPAGGVLTGAKFSYCYFDFSGGATSLKIGVKAVTQTDKPSSQTWRAYYQGLTWNTTFGNSNFAVADDFVDYVELHDNVYSYVSWDVTALAKSWYEDESTNLGVCFDLTNRDQVGPEGVSSGNARLYAYDYTYYAKFIVEYRDTVGVEGYYSYQTLPAGRAGAAYVGDYTGEVTVIKSDAAVTAGAIGAGVSHVYNSAYYTTAQPDNVALTGMHFGKGWSLDAIQTVTESSSMLIYTDGDGTRHAFTRANSSSPYLDEDGLGLKITKTATSPVTYALEDYSGNKMTFVNGLLYEKQDAWGNKLRYVYTGTSGKPTGGGTDKLQRIDVFNSGSTSASYTAATFAYSASGYLTSITDYSGNATTYTYDSSNRLTSITHPDGTTATYSYTTADRLDYLQDNEGKLRLCLSWDASGVTGWVHKDVTNASSPVSGAVVTASRTLKEAEYIVEGRSANAPSRRVVYLFDYAGRTVYSYSSSEDGSVIYGTASGSYTDTAARARTNNRLSGESATGRLSVNLLTGGTMETAGGSMPQNWALTTGVTGTSAARSTAQKHTGSAGLAITSSSAQSTAAKVKYSGALSLKSGEKYTLSAYIRTTGVTFSGTNPGAYLSVTTSSGTTDSAKISHATLTAADDGWARAYVTFTAGTSNTLNLCVTGMKGTVYFDDVQLEIGDAPGSANLLEYGSVEEAGTWTLTNGSIVSLTTPTGRSGKGIKLSGGPDVDAHAVSTVSINLPGTESFALSAWAKASAVPYEDSYGDVKAFRLKAVITYSDNTTEIHTGQYNSDVTDWQYLTLLIVPKQASKTIKSIACRCEYLQNNGAAYFDDVSLTRQVSQCYEYDEDGNLTTLGDNKTNDVTATYNGNDLTSYTDRNGVTYDYTYGDYHNVTRVTDGVLTAEYSYDTYGNVTETALTGSNTALEVASFNVSVITATTVYDLPGASSTGTTKAVGDVLTITALQLKSGAPWGRISTGGWVNLDNTNYGKDYTVCTVGKEGAAERYGPGMEYEKYKTHYSGEKVVITEARQNGSDWWGKVLGSYWIYLPATNYSSVVGTTGGADTAVDIPTDAPVMSGGTTYTTGGIILPTKSTDVMGQDTDYTYGSNISKQMGAPTKVTAPDGTQTTTTYDADNGRTTLTAVGDTASVDYTYTNGRLTEIERTADRSGTDVTQSYTITYGTFGDQTAVKVGSNTLATYTRNVRTGDIERLTYGNGDYVDYIYDDLDRLSEVKYNGTVRFRYRYTGEGQLFSVEDIALGVTYTYTYDSLGRLIYSGTLTSGGSMLYTSSAYDAAGRLSSTSYAGANISGSMTYVYDETTGLLESVTLADGGKETVLYDGIERTTKQIFTDADDEELFTRTYSYVTPTGTTDSNTSGLVASYSVGHGADTFASYDYTYDVMGRITGDGTYTYVYDGLGQLTTVKQGNTVVESYTYDGAGNILSANKNGTSHSYTYGNTNWRDQLTAYDGTAITYDAIGNPLSYRGWAFTWQNGRQLATANKSGTSISYAYDVNGLRYSKTVGGVTHSYIYSGSTLLQEKYGTTVLNFLYDADGTPYALQYSTNSGSSFTTYYYITNLQGDVIGLMDATGALVVSYTYDAWGVLISTTGSLASTLGAVNPLRYRGYYYDTETGLYYLQSRYYDASVGRFINVDAFASTGQGIVGFNMFAYCGNCPVMYSDSSGKFRVISADDLKIDSEFFEKIIEDLANYDEDNADINRVYESNYFSSYKGVFVLRYNSEFLTSGYLSGVIFLNHSKDKERYSRRKQLLDHEYGHFLQEEEYGSIRYLTKVALPSATINILSRYIPWVDDNYYNMPWEYDADVRGNVQREHAWWAPYVADIYLGF